MIAKRQLPGLVEVEQLAVQHLAETIIRSVSLIACSMVFIPPTRADALPVNQNGFPLSRMRPELNFIAGTPLNPLQFQSVVVASATGVPWSVSLRLNRPALSSVRQWARPWM